MSREIITIEEKDGNSFFSVPRNTTVYFEVDSDDFSDGISKLLSESGLDNSALGEIIELEGGQVAVTLKPQTYGYKVPIERAAEATGALYYLPSGETLRSQLVKEYGPNVLESAGALDWLIRHFPETFQDTVDVLETGVEIVESVKSSLSSGTKIVIAGAVGLLAIVVLINVLRK